MSKNDNQIDSIYADGGAEIGSFRFDERVVRVFDDMISRSVPGYQQILRLLPAITRSCCHPNKSYYDLGCSTGAGLIAMARGLGELPANLVGIDTSAPMLLKAKSALSVLADKSNFSVHLKQHDITEFEYTDAAMCLLNFTLQFIPLDQRDPLINKIYQALCKGGALVLSEKIAFENPSTQRWFRAIHHQYKADQGYSELEISQKRDAIENVLIPETFAAHQERLLKAGFETVLTVAQNLQFVSILAIK